LQFINGVRKYLLGDGLVASTGELWRRQRKLMAPFYTPKGVQAYGELMIRDGERLVERRSELARTRRATASRRARRASKPVWPEILRSGKETQGGQGMSTQRSCMDFKWT
jgi:cytochrome P450